MSNELESAPAATSGDVTEKIVEGDEPQIVIVSLPPKLIEAEDRLYWIKDEAEAILEGKEARAAAEAIRDLASEAMDLVDDVMSDLAEEDCD